MRLALNQITTNRWSVREAAEGCARAGIGAIGLWRDKVAEAGGAAAAARATTARHAWWRPAVMSEFIRS